MFISVEEINVGVAIFLAFAKDLTYAYPTILNLANPLSKQSKLTNITIENLMFLMSDASNDEIFISYSKKKISEVRLSE